jgi:hypothetical protein
MKLPNWFKVIWWIALSAVVSAFLIVRCPDLVKGHAVPADIFVFFVWIALLLVPVFQEVEFFGLKFKQEIEKAKEELNSEILSVRTELRNDVRTTISPQFTIPIPPPDSQLADVEKRITQVIKEALAVNGTAAPSPTPAVVKVSEDVMFLFATRYGLERELRQLAQERNLEIGRQRTGGLQLSRALVRAGIIAEPLDNAIREVYAVSSAAVHAEDITDAQVKFVRDVGPQLVAALQALRKAASTYQS